MTKYAIWGALFANSNGLQSIAIDTSTTGINLVAVSAVIYLTEHTVANVVKVSLSAQHALARTELTFQAVGIYAWFAL